MNYDPSLYKALGVGDRITADCLQTIHGELYPVGNGDVGALVDEDMGVTYLRAIPPPVVEKTTFPSGAARSNAAGRGRFDLIPYEAMLSLARRYEMGAVTFGDRNWEKGQPLSRLLSSLRRHAHQVGYDYSEDHMGAVLWNAAAFVTMVERIRAGILPKELDDIGYFLNEQATKP